MHPKDSNNKFNTIQILKELSIIQYVEYRKTTPDCQLTVEG